MPPPHPPHERHVPSSAISGFVDAGRLDALLAPWIPDERDRAFVVRCIAFEGPAHHRGANYVLLRLLGEILDRLPGAGPPVAGPGFEVPIRLPPHLAQEAGPGAYPLALPAAPMERLAGRGSRELEAMVDCLTDGPPQHALANVAMVNLMSEILARLERPPR